MSKNILKENIDFISDLKQINSDMLTGFFDGWNNPPDKTKLLKLLRNSAFVVIAIHNGKVIGFINAISDKVVSAYIPLLEVLNEYQGKGIGSELVRRMLEQLKDFYMVDVICDDDLQKFYEKCGFVKHTAMIKRNYQKQNGI